ncbi:MAG: ABC transporter substrate-binding protein [Beutenbergiaceae bacterium]
MKQHLWLSIAAAASALALAACTSGGTEPPTESSDGEVETTTTESYEPASVTYLTSFNTFGRDAYVYVAQEMGFFDDVGLDVTIQPGTGSVDVMKLIASGSADFGAADFSAVVVTVANEDLPVTAVAAIHQRSLAAIIALESSGIGEPADLEGRTIGDQPGSTNQVIFPTYAEAAGIDAGAVEFVPSAPPALPQLLASGQVDAIGQFVVGEPLIGAAAEGAALTVLPYSDVLPDLYGNVLITSDETANGDPELVQRFTTALMQGLQYSIDNPAETGTILQQFQPTQDADVAAAEVEIMGDYVTGGSVLGNIDPDRVDTVIEIMAPAITADVTGDDVASFDLAPQ